MKAEPKKGQAGCCRGVFNRLLLFALLLSLLINLGMYYSYRDYFSEVNQPLEKFHSGDEGARNKIAIVEISGTIMPPFSQRIMESIDRAKDDPDVKGVVLEINSPGGLVSDSHEIYHRLELLRRNKPIAVAMKSLAASGGYYVAMGAGPTGKIYAEPTTWTGSIGVIIPRFDVTQLAQKIGLSVDPLKTGEYKDALSPFRELTQKERELWDQILDDSFHRFVNVIAENRTKLDEAKVRELANGRIFTSGEALENGLIDKIGYEEDAIGDLKQQLGLKEARVVSYTHGLTAMSLLLGSVKADSPQSPWSTFLESAVPRAMYYFSWAPGIPTW